MDLDEDGYILAKDDVYTTLNGKILPGVFAAATSRTASTARPSPPPAPAAWPLSKSRSTSKSTAAKPHKSELRHTAPERGRGDRTMGRLFLFVDRSIVLPALRSLRSAGLRKTSAKPKRNTP